MAPTSDIVFDHPYIRQYKDGRIQRFRESIFVPAGTDTTNGVDSKDVIIHEPTKLAVRIYIPTHRLAQPEPVPESKIPVVLYIHGGAFVLGSAFDPQSHGYVTSLVAQADVIAVSVDYRLAPENPLPAAYEDAWTALNWVWSHIGGNGTEEWLNGNGDFSRVFLDGSSAGGNVTQQIAMRAGKEGVPDGARIEGMVLVHPFFWGVEAIGNENRDAGYRKGEEDLWKFVCPETDGADDWRINPVAENAPKLDGVGCERVLVAVAEKDWLRDRGLAYYRGLKGSGWKGEVVWFESEGEEHGFIFWDTKKDKSVELLKVIVDFVKGG